MMLLWLQPLNTSTNIAVGYNATIVCADQASNEFIIANLPIEAILSYNNDANHVAVSHLSSCSAANPVCFCQKMTHQTAHSVPPLKWRPAVADSLSVSEVVLRHNWTATSLAATLLKTLC